jgi:ABC-type transport system substrate-binding protein
MISFMVNPIPAKAQTELFEITIIAPGLANLLRQQWGLIIANSFRSVGIDARVVFIDWTGVIDRVFEPPAATLGLPFDEGGFDAELIGWTPGNPGLPFGDSYATYHSSNIPPGSCYFLWANDTADAYMETFMAEGYNAAGIQAFKDWQLIQFDDLPASQIFLSSLVTASAPYIDFHDWEWVFDNLECNPDQITGASEVVMATTGELKDVFPFLSNSWYDNLAFSPVLDQLFNVNTTYQYPIDLSLCTGIDIFINDTWSEYTFDLRSGVMFHDGHVMDADDVVYSYAAAMFHPHPTMQPTILEYLATISPSSG